MGVYGADRDLELIGDLLVCQALAHKAQHLALPGCKIAQRVSPHRWAGRSDQRRRLAAVLGLANNLKAGRDRQQQPQALAHDRMIVGHNYADRRI